MRNGVSAEVAWDLDVINLLLHVSEVVTNTRIGIFSEFLTMSLYLGASLAV